MSEVFYCIDVLLLYCPDMSQMKSIQKLSLIIVFGATGHLAQKKIFPALSHLYDDGSLAEDSRVIGVSRREWARDSLHEFLKAASDVSLSFLDIAHYALVDFEKGVGYEALAREIAHFSKTHEILIYLSLAPQYFAPVIKALRKSSILRRGKTKLLLEKPFGTDEKTACALNRLLTSFLSTSQVYRIDHYLGKSTVQAMMRVHESSPSLRSIISARTVESVSVTLLEARGIDGRGASYDGVGAFRDVGQNHMLEVLASLLAEYPRHASASSWHDARAKVLENLLPPKDTCELARRGQYEGYGREQGVKSDSLTETAFEVITGFSRGELAGIPVIFQAGKMMGESRASIRIVFKEIRGLPQEIEFSIQPEAKVVIRDRDGRLESIEFSSSRDAYQNVLLDALRGESRHFVGAREIQAAWRYADRVVACWGKVPLERYSESKPFLF
jgi:glucose-6-phosphate 1-dehydrogenase